MKTILILTDYSKNSLKAVEFAFDYFDEKDNHFILCHFYTIPKGGTSALFTLLDQLKNQAVKDMVQIRKMVENKHPNHKASITTKVEHGSVYEKAKNLSIDSHADFLVMGNKGATGMKEILIGSTASKLLKEIGIPVFAVPELYTKNDIKELFFSYDGEKINKNTAQIIASFSKENSLAIQILHFHKEHEVPKENWNKIKGLFIDCKPSLVEISANSYEEGINEIIEDAKCILVLIRRKKSIWQQLINQSESQKLVRHLAVPIFVIPESLRK